MKKSIKTTAALAATVLALIAGSAWAKLPAPSDEAKAKAAETAAKTAHTGKMANYQLCMSMDKVAGSYLSEAKKTGKEIKPVTTTPACENPGPFVYTPPAPVAAAAPASAAKP